MTSTYKKMRVALGFRNIKEVAKVIDVEYLFFWKMVDEGHVSPPTHVVGKRRHYKVEEIDKIKAQLSNFI